LVVLILGIETRGRTLEEIVREEGETVAGTTLSANRVG
jgi:hypothetical protein